MDKYVYYFQTSVPIYNDLFQSFSITCTQHYSKMTQAAITVLLLAKHGVLWICTYFCPSITNSIMIEKLAQPYAVLNNIQIKSQISHANKLNRINRGRFVNSGWPVLMDKAGNGSVFNQDSWKKNIYGHVHFLNLSVIINKNRQHFQCLDMFDVYSKKKH